MQLCCLHLAYCCFAVIPEASRLRVCLLQLHKGIVEMDTRTKSLAPESCEAQLRIGPYLEANIGMATAHGAALGVVQSQPSANAGWVVEVAARQLGHKIRKLILDKADRTTRSGDVPWDGDLSAGECSRCPALRESITSLGVTAPPIVDSATPLRVLLKLERPPEIDQRRAAQCDIRENDPNNERQNHGLGRFRLLIHRGPYGLRSQTLQCCKPKCRQRKTQIDWLHKEVFAHTKIVRKARKLKGGYGPPHNNHHDGQHTK